MNLELFFPFTFLISVIVICGVVLVIVLNIRKAIKHHMPTIRTPSLHEITDNLQDLSRKMGDMFPAALQDREAACLPLIRRDDPSFSPTLAYTYAKEGLRMRLSDLNDLRIHRVVISDYKSEPREKTVILQAALQYENNGSVEQKRYVLLYTLTIGKDNQSPHCPNCGAPLSDPKAAQCPYCDSRLFPQDADWRISEIYEG